MRCSPAIAPDYTAAAVAEDAAGVVEVDCRGAAHGYAIIESLRTRSAGVFDLPEGTIYPALHRLERSGVVTSGRETVGGRERRVYRLSAKGRVALRERRNNWHLFAGAVSQIMGTSDERIALGVVDDEPEAENAHEVADARLELHEIAPHSRVVASRHGTLQQEHEHP